MTPGRDRAPRTGGGRVKHDNVTAYIASLNTAWATELCVRTMRHFEPTAFDIVVGDGGSTDRSLAMLGRLESKGWIRVQRAPEGRAHAAWLAECQTRYALFSDSDVEFREPGWLTDMVKTAERTGGALVCGRMQHGVETFLHPVTRAELRIALRPTAWLFLVDTHQVRDTIDATFEYVEVEDFNAFGRKVAYDTAAWFFRELSEAGLTWAEMPPSWQTKYHHFGSMTWLAPTRSGIAVRIRLRQAAKLSIIALHLARARSQRWGD